MGRTGLEYIERIKNVLPDVENIEKAMDFYSPQKNEVLMCLLLAESLKMQKDLLLEIRALKSIVMTQNAVKPGPTGIPKPSVQPSATKAA